MTLATFLAEGRIRPRQYTRREIDNLIRIAERDLNDAAVEQLSNDRRFLLAYDAALKLATVPLNCAGYETHGQGHHWITFQVLPELMGQDLEPVSIYLESCRTKRNVGTYDRSGELSETDAAELLEETQALNEKVQMWKDDNCS